jgi:hypothetical protein
MTQDDLDIKLSKDLKLVAREMSRPEAVNLIQIYYRIQDQRIRAGGQAKALERLSKPNALVEWTEGKMELLEKRVAKLLDYYSAEHPVAQWARSQKGIGPVLSTACLALIDPTRTVTAGDLWAYSGNAPGQRRRKGQKSNWNPLLKVTSWKIGQSFVKVSGDDEAFYGRIYRERKAYEQAKNDRHEYTEQAAGYLEGRKYDPSTEAYKSLSQGLLPPFLIQRRSERYAAKLFLAHFLEVYRDFEGLPSVAPWPIVHGHAHYIAPPNWTKKSPIRAL